MCVYVVLIEWSDVMEGRLRCFHSDFVTVDAATHLKVGEYQGVFVSLLACYFYLRRILPPNWAAVAAQSGSPTYLIGTEDPPSLACFLPSLYKQLMGPNRHCQRP